MATTDNKLLGGAGLEHLASKIKGELADKATIDDTSTSSLTETWSANKLNTVIGDIETLLEALR